MAIVSITAREWKVETIQIVPTVHTYSLRYKYKHVL